MRLIVVTGMSGAGKSVAMHALEDLGYYCVDNLPVSLLRGLAQELGKPGWPVERAAIGVDARSPREMLTALSEIVAELRESGMLGDLLFLDAADDVLIERYSETRRKHPLTAGSVSLAEAIRQERELLAPVKLLADTSIDTTRMHLHQLRELIWTQVERRQPGTLSVLFLSFGYKYGLPHDADMIFDVRCLPNPHWEPTLRGLTGRDEGVATYLAQQPMVEEYHQGLCGFLDVWIPRFEADRRAYLTIAIGCTGGRHRSVYMVERLAEHFRARRVITRHREIG